MASNVPFYNYKQLVFYHKNFKSYKLLNIKTLNNMLNIRIFSF